MSQKQARTVTPQLSRKKTQNSNKRFRKESHQAQEKGRTLPFQKFTKWLSLCL